MPVAQQRIRCITRKLVIEPDFNQIDMMGVAHNAAYFYWFERGRLAILWQILPLEEAICLGIAMPVVRQTCEYRKAVRYGDRLILTTSHEVLRQYEGRFIFKHSLMHETTKMEAASSEVDLVVLDLRSGQLLRDLPSAMWERYQALV